MTEEPAPMPAENGLCPDKPSRTASRKTSLALAALIAVSVLAIELQAREVDSLKTIPVELPAEIDAFVQDRDAALQLGKALFWDVQVGSDGVTACATCHYHAGVDNRTADLTLNPGRFRVRRGVPVAMFVLLRPG